MPPKHSVTAGGNQGKSQWGLTYFVAAVYLALMNSEQVCGSQNGGHLFCLSHAQFAKVARAWRTKIYVGLRRQRQGQPEKDPQNLV